MHTMRKTRNWVLALLATAALLSATACSSSDNDSDRVDIDKGTTATASQTPGDSPDDGTQQAPVDISTLQPATKGKLCMLSIHDGNGSKWNGTVMVEEIGNGLTIKSGDGLLTASIGSMANYASVPNGLLSEVTAKLNKQSYSPQLFKLSGTAAGGSWNC